MKKNRIGLGSLMEVPHYSLGLPKPKNVDPTVIDKLRFQTLKVALGSAKVVSKAAHIVRETPGFLREIRDTPGMFSTGLGMNNYMPPETPNYQGMEYPDQGDAANG